MSLIDDVAIAPLVPDLARVEARLAGAVEAADPLLDEVAGHLLKAGGKRLRPALALCAAYAARGAAAASEDAVTGAAAVELVHLGSLYHDDVIDEAETRRGVPSVNARWSNIVAILAGDFLLARASALAASLGAEVAALLADTIGELCRGQVLELAHIFDVTRTEESYLSSVEGKTASLMATSCRVGGMVSGVPDETLDALTRFGHHLGVCFQIVDDVLDVTATEAELGKPAGNDVHEGVYTLPVIHALAGSPELHDLLGRRLDWPEVRKAVALVATPEIVAASMAVAREHAEAARAALGVAGGLDPAVCDRLQALIDGMLLRTN
ncbi:MAG: polyprenyl synthetase family protein [Actinomycetota bacterium]